MDKQLEQLINKAKQMKMTQREKLFMRSELSSFAASHGAAEMPSPYLLKSHFWTIGKMLIAACLIIVLGGGSLAFASEKSLPGDMLYPIKININEKIISALQFTPEAKIAWQEKIVDRRLAEISALADNGKLNEKTKAQIENKLKESLDAASKISHSNNINTDSISSKVQKGLSKLGALNEENESLSPLLIKVHDENQNQQREESGQSEHRD